MNSDPAASSKPRMSGPPVIVGRYAIYGEIAAGGMATVHLGRLQGEAGFARTVAIKRLHPQFAKDPDFVNMFLDEARIAARIRHPNVVSTLDVVNSEGELLLVMDYVHGESLSRLVRIAGADGGFVPINVGCGIVSQALLGLHAAHEAKTERGEPLGIVHRDVSPQNILVGMDGVSRITDFGVARAASRLSATRVGQLKGKIAYMAPEQAAGDTRVDRRADIFSAGIVLWEVLASRRLFKAENEAATLSRVVSEPIPNLHDLAPDVHPQISLVCMKALERDPDKRFSTCAQFADVLERAAAAVGKIAAPREVAAYVQEVIGTEISQQRDAVRAWLARSEPSQLERPNFSLSTHPPAAVGASSSVSAGNMELSSVNTQSGLISHPQLSQISQVSEVHNARRSKAPLVIGGVALLLALGVGGLVAAGSTKEEGPATAGAPETPKVEAPPADKPAAEPKEEPKAEPEKQAAKPEASAEAKEEDKEKAEEEKKAASRPVYGGGWRPRATQKPEKEEEPPPAKPAPTAKTPEVDLSNPYK